MFFLVFDGIFVVNMLGLLFSGISWDVECGIADKHSKESQARSSKS